MKEETKKDRGLALKAMGRDDSDINEEDVVFVTRKFKKLFKKVGKSIKKGDNSKARNNDQDQNLSYCEILPHAEGRTGTKTVQKPRKETTAEWFYQSIH